MDTAKLGFRRWNVRNALMLLILTLTSTLVRLNWLEMKSVALYDYLQLLKVAILPHERDDCD